MNKQRTYSIPTPDDLSWASKHYAQSCDLLDGALVVRWSDQSQSRYHPVWLRDNCACDTCLHQVTREHLIDLRDIAFDEALQSVDIEDDGAVVVHWPEHSSRFNPAWLYRHRELANDQQDSVILWDRQSLSEPPSFTAQDGVVSDALVCDVLLSVQQTGLARLRGLSSEPDVVERLALRIGPIRETHFERIFDVISRPDADSNAYTSEYLAAHTDIPTRETPPGLQLLHCMVNNADGGESTMSDGFAIAEELRRNHPEEFANLCTTEWCFASRAGDANYRWTAPVIGLDRQGKVTEVRSLPFSRAPLQTAFDNIEPAYRALRLFMSLANDSRYKMTYPFVAGDLIVFDNRRILHGRTAFNPQSGDRALRGTYIERDDMHAYIRRNTNSSV